MSKPIIDCVDEKLDKIRTRSLDLSFNELFDMYQENELIIDPEYQRLFRWSEEKQSRFIESLILEMPIPPIFVIEKSEGVYELIDGLQRISSYLHFRGAKLKNIKVENCLKLKGCDIVPELNGLTYEKLERSIQIKLKRNFIRVEVLRKESDKRLRYYMFKRLNTGGELLSEQEIRNCTTRLLGTSFNDFIVECSENTDFKKTIENINEQKISQKYDQELVLRFFSIKNNLEKYGNSLQDFMTNFMENVTNKSIDFNYDYEREIFSTTFKLLNKINKNNIFASNGKNKTRYKKDFFVYYYDAFAVGLARHIDNSQLHNSVKPLKDIFKEIKLNSSFPSKTGGQKNTQKRIEFIDNKINNLLDGK